MRGLCAGLRQGGRSGKAWGLAAGTASQLLEDAADAVFDLHPGRVSMAWSWPASATALPSLGSAWFACTGRCCQPHGRAMIGTMRVWPVALRCSAISSALGSDGGRVPTFKWAREHVERQQKLIDAY